MRNFNNNIKYRSFEEASKFIGSLGIESWTEWHEYCKSGKKPDDIPFNFYEVYGNPKSSYYDKTFPKMNFNKVETHYPFCYHNFKTGETFSYEYMCEKYPDFESNFREGYSDVPIITKEGEIFEKVDWLLNEDKI